MQIIFWMQSVYLQMENGGTLIGRWPTEEYDYDNSLAEDGNEFLGLLDNDNEEK